MSTLAEPTFEWQAIAGTILVWPFEHAPVEFQGLSETREEDWIAYIPERFILFEADTDTPLYPPWLSAMARHNQPAVFTIAGGCVLMGCWAMPLRWVEMPEDPDYADGTRD